MSLENDIFLRAVRCEPVPYTPVWIMRQAGRYLPEYQRLRAMAGDFLNLCKNPELAATATLLPVERYPLDAAIIFSDILVIPDAMGLGLYFEEGPKFHHPLITIEDIENLPALNPQQDLSYVVEAIQVTQHKLQQRLPLIGFAGSPWTIATYMIENDSPSRHQFHKIKKVLYETPDILHLLLNKLTVATSDYLKAQIKAGVNCVMVFDSWGGALAPQAYQEFSLTYLQQIVNNLKQDPTTQATPIILFSKNANAHLNALANSGCQALGIDWTISLKEARTQIGNQVALQGNLDPSILLCDRKVIEHEVKNILIEYGKQWGHIFNLGHGITPQAKPENVATLIDTVHRVSAEIFES